MKEAAVVGLMSLGVGGALLSVIIPTRNRSMLLREAIESLWSQSLAPSRFEVIVVDNGSTDGTAEVIGELRRRSPCSVRYHRMDPPRGPTQARNVGARLARGEILAFTDSDCRLVPTWLEAAVDAFSRDERVGFACGPVRNKPEQPVTFFSQGIFTNEGENPLYPTCNIFYRRRVFFEVGGFDDFGLGPLGSVDAPTDDSDADLAWKVKNAGYASVYLSDLLVYHEVRRLTVWQWLTQYARAIQIHCLFKRNPALRKRLLWWGPFAYRENLYFYMLAIGVALVCLGWHWGATLTGPYVWWAARVPRRRLSLTTAPHVAARVLLLSLRHAVICGALVYGSIRTRTLVL